MLIKNPTIDEVISNLSPDHLNLIFMAENCDIEMSELVFLANLNSLRVAGGMFPGIISDTKNYDNAIIIRRADSNVEVEVIENLSSGEATLPDKPGYARSAMVLIDGLVSHISRFLEKIHTKYWDSLQIIGGGCGSLSLEQQPCVFTNKGVMQDAAILIYLPNGMSVGIQHGWKKIAGPFVVSKSNGNVIEELNWKPALEVYKEILAPHISEEITEENFFNMSKGYPFGIYREGEEDVVRDPISIKDNTLFCVGEVESNSVVHILKGENQDLINSAKQAAQDAIQEFTPDNTFVIDCISRVLFMEEAYTDELKAIKSTINVENRLTSLEGVLSLGEIASSGDGYIEFFNKTIVVAALK